MNAFISNMEKTNFKRHTITAALPYANGPVHIGHLAGAYLPADIYVRYLREKNEDVLFVCGTDEHGVAITIKALQENTTPQEIVNKYHKIIKEGFAEIDIDFDIFHRTSAETHHETAQDFFSKFYKEGKLIEKESEQLYDQKENMFLADRYVTGTCPKCSYVAAYGDQCEKCGSALSPDELINPRSTLSGTAPIKKKTKHWYLPLQDYQTRLDEFVESSKDRWKPNVYGQCKSWLNDGLRERAITRDMKWGVKVPVKNMDDKVLYVWFDAPIGYISATKAWAEENNTDWEKYWKDDETCLVHFIGKDNIVFHCLIFPSMLMGYGDYILPHNIPANEFLNLEGDKISTSRNWAVWLHEFVADYPEKTDVLRYVLTAIMPETKDSDFSWKDFQTRNNSELVAILGNFVNRVAVLSNKYFEGKIQSLVGFEENFNPILEECQVEITKIEESLENFRFRDGLQAFMNIARIGNKFLADSEPWHLIKSDKKQVGAILNVSAQIIAYLAITSKLFLPKTSKKLFEILKIEEKTWDSVESKEIVPENHKIIEKAPLLFEKIDDQFIEAEIAKLQEKRKTQVNRKYEVVPIKENIEFETFANLDLRIAEILEAKRVPKTDKLLEIQVDLGTELRTVVSGIAQFYTVEEIIGKKVLYLANLAPKKLRGIESQGMILLAETPDRRLIFVSPESSAENGSLVK